MRNVKDNGDELKNTVRWALVGLTAMVYWRVSSNGFVNYDDPIFVLFNPHVYSGLTIANTIWAFTTLNGGVSSYHPLTWLTHQLDCQLFGLRSGPQHLTNLWFHVCNTALLFTALERATGKLWRSAMVAVLFALHPLHVETVAWISERKSLVCTFFWLLTTLRYVRYAREGGALNYALMLVLYTAALLSKPLAVSLPITLLLLDYWPLARFRLPQDTPSIILEKVPMFLLCAMFCCVTVLAQDDLGAIKSLKEASVAVRLSNSAMAYVLYLQKTIWPVHLAPIYPLRYDLASWQVICCSVLLTTVSLWIVRQAHKRPYLLVGWVWYLVTLFPMLGAVQVGSQAMADRYSYVPLIGVFLLVVWGVTEEITMKAAALPEMLSRTENIMPSITPILKMAFARGSENVQRTVSQSGVSSRCNTRSWRCLTAQSFLLLGAIAVVGGCAIATLITVRYWKDSFGLFRHAVRVTNGNYIAHRQLGLALFNAGKIQEALTEFRESLKLHPNEYTTEACLGWALFWQGDDMGAFEHCSRAIRLKPTDAQAHMTIAQIYSLSKTREVHNPKTALLQARLACGLSRYQNRQILEEMVKICADNDDFRGANEMAQRALSLCVLPQERQYTYKLMADIKRMELMIDKASGPGTVPTDLN